MQATSQHEGNPCNPVCSIASEQFYSLCPLCPQNLTQLFDTITDLCFKAQLTASILIQANLLHAMQANLSRFRPSLSPLCL